MSDCWFFFRIEFELKDEKFRFWRFTRDPSEAWNGRAMFRNMICTRVIQRPYDETCDDCDKDLPDTFPLQRSPIAWHHGNRSSNRIASK